MKILAVGDLHTKTWIPLAVQKIIDNYDAVVFVGDYADDWNKKPQDTIDTWRILRMLQAGHKDKVHLVIGNHDYAYLLDRNPSSSGFNPTTKLLLSTPENRSLKEWLSKIPIKVELDSVTYSHAGYQSGWSEEHGYWNDESPLWARPIFPNFSSQRQYLPNQVFGHTPSETCWEVEPNVWCIDSFSTYRDGRAYGDGTVLEIIDGKEFKVIKLEK